MITLRDLAADLDRDYTAVRRRALQHDIPMVWIVNPATHQRVLAFEPAAEKRIRAVYAAPLK